MPKPGRLRNRIIAWSFIPTSLILLLVALVILRSYQQVTEDLVLGRNRELTRLAAGQLSAKLEAYPEGLAELAEAPVIRQGVAGRQAQYLQQNRNRLVVYDGGVVILNNQGQVSASVGVISDVRGVDLSSQPFFHQMLRSMAPTFSDVFTFGGEDQLVLAVAVPIHDDQGSFGGAAVGLFRLGATSFSAFYGGIVKLRIAEDTNTFIVDGNGQLVFHPEPALVGSRLAETWIVEQIAQGQVDAVHTRDLQGHEVLASFAPVPGTPWGLVTEEDWSAVTASSRSYIISLLLLLGLGLAIPALVVTVGVSRLTQPIGLLGQVAKRVAQGDFGQTVEVKTGDEIEHLADQINEMSAQLRESYSDLERKVEARTRELATLLEVMQAASSSLDFDVVLRQVAVRLARAVGVGYCTIYQVDEAGGLLVPTAGRAYPDSSTFGQDRAYQPTEIDPARDAFVREVLTSQTTVACSDAASDPRINPEVVRRIGLKSSLAVPFVVKGRVLAVAILMTLEDQHIFTQDEVDLADGIARTVGLLIENAQLYRAEQEGHEEAERRRRVAEGLREVLAVLNSQQSLPEMLDFIVRQSCQLVGCEASAILQPRGESGALHFGSSCGLDATRISDLVVPPGLGIAGRAVAERRPILATDIVNTIGASAPSGEWPSKTEWPIVRHFADQFQTVLALPLVARDKALGALALYYRERRVLSEEEIRLAQSVADQAALALETARLREQAGQAAASAERTRLARELHDSVTQSLYSVTLYGEAAARLLTNGKTEEAAGHLRELRDTSQEALREMRLLIFQLRPPALERSGLVGALQARLESVELRGGTDAGLSVEHPEGLSSVPLGVQEQVYHIALEALNNVLRHAKADHVRVNLAVSESRIILEVQDDGRGFLPEKAATSGGMGLPGMRERADRIGAILELHSQPGTGTRLRLEVPIEPSPRSEDERPSGG
jgi:signal transduction histidine kinase/HAMP domain-containing protein